MRMSSLYASLISLTGENNSYYVLRDDMLGYYVDDIAQRLAARQENEGWQVCFCPHCNLKKNWHSV